MKPGIVYLLLTAVLSVLAVSIVAETPHITTSLYRPASVVKTEGIDRADAVDIARRVISNANDDIDGRITIDVKKNADGGWQVLARWGEDGALQTAYVTIDLAGNVTEYVE